MIKPPENYNQVYQAFAEKMKVYEHQERIESRKNGCMVCAFGRDGTSILMQIVQPQPQKV